MLYEETVRIGDTIECFEGHNAVIEKIKIISTGEFIEQYQYDGTDAYDIMLILKDDTGIRVIIECCGLSSQDGRNILAG